MNIRTLVGIVAILAGATMVLFFRDAHLLWFQGGFLGIALIILGGLDLVEAQVRQRQKQPTGILEELRRDLFGQQQGNQAPTDPSDAEDK